MNMLRSRLLLVEDDPIYRGLVHQALEGRVGAIVDAEDGAQARALLALDPSFDCILLDRGLPDCDGLALLRELKTMPAVRDVPVVLQTGRSEVEAISEGMAAGAYYYLTKPFHPPLLEAVVRAALDAAHDATQARQALVSASHALRMLGSGQFQFRTIAEARELAAALAPLCPQPEGAVLVLQELLINAVEHGNLAIDYATKRDLILDGDFQAEIEQRLRDPRYAGRRVQVALARESQEVRITIADEGPGFDWREFLEFSPERLFDPNGRGILMARASGVQRLDYVGRGNIVTAVWRLEALPAEPAIGQA